MTQPTRFSLDSSSASPKKVCPWCGFKLGFLRYRSGEDYYHPHCYDKRAEMLRNLIKLVGDSP